MTLLRCAAAVLLGGVTTCGFAPYDWPALTLLGLAGLFELWRAATPGRAALYGLCFGAAHFASGVYWVFISTHRYGGAPAWLSIWLVILLSTYMSLYPALLGWLTTRWRAPGAARWALLQVPAAWVLAELVRGWLGTGFPWLSLGYAWVDTPLAKIAPLTGVYGLSGLVVLAAGGLWLLWRGARTSRIQAITVLALAALAVLLLPPPARWTTVAGEPLAVGIVQGNIPQQMKWDRREREAIKQHYLKLTATLPPRARLIIWPEVAIPAVYSDERPFLDGLAQWAQARGQTLLVGVLWRSGPTLYNTMLALGAGQGEAGRFYLKRHLVPFGEFFPVPGFLRAIMQGLQLDYGDFTHGPAEQPPIIVAGQTLGLSICFEDAFGREIRKSLPAAGVLVTVTNDGWFDEAATPWQHLQIARLRALETGRELVRVSNRGVSGVIGPDGALHDTLGFFETGARLVQVQPRTGSTPYVRFGELPLGLLSLGLLLVGGLRRRPFPSN